MNQLPLDGRITDLEISGKGFEDEKYYTNTRFHFQNVENIHVMRNSLARLVEGKLKFCHF